MLICRYFAILVFECRVIYYMICSKLHNIFINTHIPIFYRQSHMTTSTNCAPYYLVYAYRVPKILSYQYASYILQRYTLGARLRNHHNPDNLSISLFQAFSIIRQATPDSIWEICKIPVK